ncbi:MAG: ABC transporter substrate-binding protein [Lachnospiraceae bacterium]
MKRKWLALLMVIAVIGTMGGCGSKENKDSKKTTEKNETSGEMKTVKVVMPRDIECLDDMAMWIGDSQGYFKEQGLKLEMISGANPSDIQMVATGKADLACPSPNVTMAQIESGVAVKVVSGYDAINIYGFSAVNGGKVKDWADLKGCTIALGDASWESIAAPTLVAAGLDPKKDVKYVVSGDSRYQMVAEGKADVLFTWISEYEQLKGMGYDFNYLDGSKILDVFGASWVAGNDFLEKNGETYQKFLYALQKSIYFMYKNPEAAADITCNQFPEIEVEWAGALGCANGRVGQALGLNGTLEEYFINEKGVGYMKPEAWETVISNAASAGVIGKELATDECYTDKYLPELLSTEDKADAEADAKAYKCTSEVYKAAQ